MFDETICAPATPPLNSPIAIIRISGPRALELLHSVFSRPDSLAPRTAVYGEIRQDDAIIDDVIAVYFRAPSSFTGEDMAEIYCHGNPLIVKKILTLCSRFGVRMADPGEFSRRAYLNGKMDLTGAEAVNHIIRARSEWELDASLKQMHGSLKTLIHRIRDDLILLKADIECAIDFIEEDIEFVSHDQAAARLAKVREAISDILARCRRGERMVQGVDLPIVGRPNVGKSSILNMILNAERAIVSDIPGTTRDLIRETIQFAGIHVNLFDTAGIDSPGCEIERMGIEMSLEKIASSALVLLVIDAFAGVTDSDMAIMPSLAGREIIVLANKIDLLNDERRNRALDDIRRATGFVALAFSAKSGEGLDALEREIERRLSTQYLEFKNFFIADFRMTSLLEKALEAADGVGQCLRERQPPEITGFAVQELIDALMEITGEITPDTVLDSIFSRFWIGK